jgi:hypothetical protein
MIQYILENTLVSRCNCNGRKISVGRSWRPPVQWKDLSSPNQEKMKTWIKSAAVGVECLWRWETRSWDKLSWLMEYTDFRREMIAFTCAGCFWAFECTRNFNLDWLNYVGSGHSVKHERRVKNSLGEGR